MNKFLVLILLLLPQISQAATTITYSFGPLCAGGNHIEVTATLTDDGVVSKIKFPLTIADLKDAPTKEENINAALIVLRLMVKQMSGNTLLQIKNAIEAKTVDLTVP